MSCVEALNLIHMCIERTDYLYPHVQRLVAELDSYALSEVTVFNAGIRFVAISDIELDIVS